VGWIRNRAALTAGELTIELHARLDVPDAECRIVALGTCDPGLDLDA
jgi:hypothetical protein